MTRSEEIRALTNWYLVAATLRLLLIALFAGGPTDHSAADIPELRMLRQGSTVASGVATKDLIVRQFSQHDPHYVHRRSAFEEQVRDVAERIARLEAAGRALSCTTQIYHEVKWLVQYTAYWQRVERRLADLEASFGVADQTFADSQSPDDGAWGACFEPTFLRISATADALELLRTQNAAPAFPITLEPSLRTSRQVVERVSSLIVSDVEGFGINHRAQLNSLITTITRGMFKPHWQDFLTTQVKMLPRHRNPAGPLELRQRMRTLLDAWQDPDTGFWGAWYKTGGALVRTTDLSITFHIISYLRGEIERWPLVLSTLRAIKHEPYPYGWLHDGGYVNHNNYDVARMLSYGWPHLSPQDRAFFKDELAAMLAWTLTDSLTDDGRFRTIPDFFESLSADYYYGVQFLDVIGFWDVKKRFWTATEFPKAAEVCTRIRRSIERDGLTDSTAMHVRERLDEICPG